MPELINYQGRVFLENGASDVTATYDIEFLLYHESTGDAPPVWGELHTGVQIARGIFNVLLGAGMAIPDVPHEAGAIAEAFRADAVYLSLRVGDEAPIRIRQQFSSAPHAFSVQNALTAIHGVPPGTVIPFAGSGSVPYGWLSCNGQSLSTVDYPALHAAIGHTWGGSGEAFNLPGLNGRIPVGADVSNPLATARGAKTHNLTREELPPHTHGYQDKRYVSELKIYQIWPAEDKTADNRIATESWTTIPYSSGGGHNNIQPSAVVQYIIKW